MRGLLFLALALPLCSCTKDTRDIAQELGLTPAACGKDDNRLLQASFDGSSYCADVQLAAIGDGTSVIITGVALSGNTLVLQLDTLAEGTHAITEASNGVLLVRPDGSWTVSGEQQGSLTIDHHDPGTQQVDGTFVAALTSGDTGPTRTIEGRFNVAYTK